MNGVPLQDVVLDAAALGQLLFDIEHAAQVLGIVLRPLGVRRAANAASTLADATRALADRSASVQLRYRYADEEWWDTLIPLPAGVRLIRISHTRALATPGES